MNGPRPPAEQTPEEPHRKAGRDEDDGFERQVIVLWWWPGTLGQVLPWFWLLRVA